MKNGLKALKHDPELIAVQDGRTTAGLTRHDPPCGGRSRRTRHCDPVVEPWIRTAKRTARLHASSTAAACASYRPRRYSAPTYCAAPTRRSTAPNLRDDASVVEQAGEAVFLCEGERTNLKITTPEDMVIAEALLAGRKKTEEDTDGENL